MLSSAIVSCEQSAIRGTVVDVAGQPLPGVAVSVGEGDAQAVTDALGQYKVPSTAGPLEVHFMKTGYTAGLLVLEPAESRAVMAQPVRLWFLPPEAGVYLFEDFRYRRAASAEPKPYSSKETGVIYALPKLPEMPFTLLRAPLVTCHNVPSYDIQLGRLAKVKAAPLDAPTAAREVWAVQEALPIEAVPIDEPERMLWEVRILTPLGPAVYALHWGALSGHSNPDPRAFVFRVTDAEHINEPIEAPEPIAPEAAKGAATGPKDKPAPKPQPEKPAGPNPADAEAAPDTPGMEGLY